MHPRLASKSKFDAKGKRKISFFKPRRCEKLTDHVNNDSSKMQSQSMRDGDGVRDNAFRIAFTGNGQGSEEGTIFMRSSSEGVLNQELTMPFVFYH